MCLQSHYRKQLVFSYPVLEQVQNQYNKLINKISLIKEEGNLQKDKSKKNIKIDLKQNYLMT